MSTAVTTGDPPVGAPAPSDGDRPRLLARPSATPAAGASHVPWDDRMRERLRIVLLGRFLFVAAFLAAVLAARLYYQDDETIFSGDATLIGASVAFVLTLVSAIAVRRVSGLHAFGYAQVVFDVLLITGVIVAVAPTLAGPFVLIYFLAIANAAGLLLWRGAMLTALASSLAYLGLVRHFAGTGVAVWIDGSFAPTLLAVTLLFAGAFMVGSLAQRLARAEDALARRDEEVERLEGVQRALANDLECGVLTTDMAGRVRSANPAAQHILGLAAAATLGREIRWLIPTLATAEDDEAREAGFVECDLRSGDGSDRRLRVKRTALVDTYGNAAGELVLLQDMTRILELEDRLVRGEEIGLVLAEGEGGEGESAEAAADAPDGMLGTCPAMRSVGKLIDKVSQTDATVLVTGESGTGKELVARAIHQRSNRAHGPFVVVNCGAIPENLIESELFGHVKGAFTGAVADRPGLFRRAHGGTIFLDEIGELPLHLQVRLLRVLQDHMIMPVGGGAQVAVDVRVIAATNRLLEEAVKAGQYREDLYYRLAVISITLPPLRERGRDVERLIAYFLRQAAERHAKRVAGVSARAMHLLMRYPYPGNVRELENVIEHATTLCDGETIREIDLPDAVREGSRQRAGGASAPAFGAARESGAVNPAGDEGRAPANGTPPASWNRAPDGPAAEGPGWDGALLLPIDEGEGASLDDQLERREKAMLLAALARADGVKKKAAVLLGINYRSFRHRLQKYALDTHDGDEVPRFDTAALARERGH